MRAGSLANPVATSYSCGTVQLQEQQNNQEQKQKQAKERKHIQMAVNTNLKRAHPLLLPWLATAPVEVKRS